MLTFIAFLITIAGCTNWMMIGLLQYDFIAGLFGYQGSMLSRLVYILFGLAAAYLIIRVIANKGTFKVFEKKNKKQNEQQSAESSPQPATVNVEASQEKIKKPKRKRWWQFWKKKQKKQPPVQSENVTQATAFTTAAQSPNALPQNQDNLQNEELSQNQQTLFDEHLK